MERDFMGLAVKQETPHTQVIDAAPLRSRGMFRNKAPQLLSFGATAQEDQTNKDTSHASVPFVAITTDPTLDSPAPNAMQKTIVPQKQAGFYYTMTKAYPTKDVDVPATIHRAVPTQTNPTAVFPAAVQQSLRGHSLMSPQPLAAVHVPNATSSNGPVVGTTDLRNATKVSGGPAQLTIFYNGAVCVYENITPEKAQAIMLLAGNRSQVASSPSIPSTPTPTPMTCSRPCVPDGLVMSTATLSHSSPAAIPPIAVSHGWPAASSMNVTGASNQGARVVSSQKVEPLKLVKSPGPVSASYLLPGTVPQFRKKSLARFLEKRRERVSNASPYENKELADGKNTKGVGSTNLSPTCSTSGHISTVN